MEESLKKQIELLEKIVDLQRQLLAAKGTSYPVYVPYTPYLPSTDPWQPWKPYGPVWTGSETVSDNISYTITNLYPDTCCSLVVQ